MESELPAHARKNMAYTILTTSVTASPYRSSTTAQTSRVFV
jgi:hypothetical protein